MLLLALTLLMLGLLMLGLAAARLTVVAGRACEGKRCGAEKGRRKSKRGDNLAPVRVECFEFPDSNKATCLALLYERDKTDAAVYIYKHTELN